ncbi:MAG: helix-turn-helix domain-containing protein [Verrucomicrobia bacterium]|nr:helix-turn-helix domain-containing protein [Verrucomicrobiota bacterium]
METTSSQGDTVATLEEAARFLKVTPVTIRRLIVRKKLRRVPFLRHIRVPWKDLRVLAAGTLS